MTREEKIERAIKGRQLFSYEEWYKLNELAFMLSNKYSPRELYEEYVNEVLGE